VIAPLNGLELHYDDIGTGLPVVFIHGFPLDRSMWTPQVGALVRQGRCIAPDLRGLGATTPAEPYSMDQYADDVAALFDALDVPPAVVAGLSMGGYIALAFWRRHRAKVRALVLADTRAGADTDEGREKRRRLIDVARSRGSRAVADLQIATMVGDATRQRRPDVVATVHAMMAAAPVEGIVGALEAMMARPDSTATLATIDVPTLIIVGEEDTLTPPKEAESLHQHIRGSRLEVIAEAGHICNLERAAAFSHILSEFVEGVAIG
jgi:3-oxoadipate enol-lactonase